jgi:hypothetical protein
MPKFIEYYVREVFGNRREFFVDKNQETIFLRLTGRKTLDTVSRELIHDLSSGSIKFKQVLPPE